VIKGKRKQTHSECKDKTKLLKDEGKLYVNRKGDIKSTRITEVKCKLVQLMP
jgi:hypothetical protein